MPIVFANPATPIPALPNLDNVVDDSVSEPTPAGETFPIGLAFKPDGTKMYVVGANTDKVYQQTLSVAWDITSAGAATSVSAAAAAPYNVFFKPDGTVMYIVTSSNSRVYQYPLPTPWDVTSTTGPTVAWIMSGNDSSMRAMAISDDGTKLFMLGATTDSVYQYTLPTPWDLTVVNYDSVSFSVASEDLTPSGLVIAANGNRMFIAGNTNDDVFEYTLNSAWSIASVSYVQNYAFVGEANVEDIAFKTDGTKMFMLGAQSDAVHQYSLS